MTLKWATPLAVLFLLTACGPDGVSGTTIGIGYATGGPEVTFERLDRAIKSLGFIPIEGARERLKNERFAGREIAELLNAYRLPTTSPVTTAAIFRRKVRGFEVSILQEGRTATPKTCQLNAKLLAILTVEYGKEHVVESASECGTNLDD